MTTTLPANERADIAIRVVMEAMREDAIAKVLRPYADKYHPGYLRSLGNEISERVMTAVGADAGIRQKLQAHYDCGNYAAMVTLAAKFERRFLNRISREVVQVKLRADVPETGFARFWVSAKREITSLIFGKVEVE